MKKRYYEMDLARSFFIFLLPLIHIYEYWGSWGGMADILKDNVSLYLSGFVHALSFFGAPTFMVCMGMNMKWTKHDSAKAFAVRGLQLLGIEVIFNLIRYVLPGLIGIAIGGVETEAAKTALWWMIYGFINSDILTFAGLAFFVFALFRKLNVKPLMICIISCLCLGLNLVLSAAAGPLIESSCNFFFVELLDNFFYINSDTTFPLLSWLIFPSFGYLIASLLDKKEDAVWKCIGILSGVVLSGCITFCLIKGMNPVTRLNVKSCKNQLDFLCGSAELAMTVLFIFICHELYVVFKLKDKPKLIRFIAKYSSGITVNYIIQWTIVGWVLFITCGTELWGCKALNMPITLMCSILIECVSYFGSQWWLKHKNR